MGRKLTTEEMIKQFIEVHGDKYGYDDFENNGVDTKSKIFCKKCKKTFLQSPYSHLKRKQGCLDCGGRKKLTKEQFVKISKEVHGNKFSYPGKYINAHTKTEIFCKKCKKVFLQSPSDHSRGKGCPYCVGRYKGKEKFIEEAMKIHGDIYEYHKYKYINVTTKSIIICKEHKIEFLQSPNVHLKGHGCPKCAGNYRLTPEEAKEELLKIHNNKYYYPNILKEFKNNKSKITIDCPDHNYTFIQMYANHQQGAGCPKCVGLYRRTIKEAKELLLRIHNGKYSYPYIDKEYKNSKSKITIDCPDHNYTFIQEWHMHQRGQGCPYCNSGCTKEYIRQFIKSILPLLESGAITNQYIIRHLFMQDELINNANSSAMGRDFLQDFFLNLNRFDIDELTNFANGDPSTIEDGIDTGDVDLFHNENEEEIIDAFGIDNGEDDDVNRNELINLNARDLILAAGNDAISNITDKDALNAIKGEFIWILIQKVCQDNDSIKEIKKLKLTKHDDIPRQIQKEFLSLYNEAMSLKIPKGCKFKIKNKIIKPLLMQRLSVVLFKKNKHFLNLSGTGAGKTFSAIWSADQIDSELTVIVCPNATTKIVWEKNIKEVCPNSQIIINDFSPKIDKNKHTFVIYNVEKFQLPESQKNINELLKNKIDCIIIDEIQFVKMRASSPISERYVNIMHLNSSAKEINSNLHILGMTATPIMNDLSEGKSLLELVSAEKYDNIEISRNLKNCMVLRGYFVANGIRWMPQYEQDLNINAPLIDCSHQYSEVIRLGHNKPWELERIFILDKLEAVKHKIKPGTIVYTQYKSSIVNPLRKEIEKMGFTVGEFTGDTKDDLRDYQIQEFIDGNIDVLVATSPIATGVDGLQTVCDNMIILCLPWTSGAYWQLIGRIHRQGQSNKKEVNVCVPLSYMEVKNEDGEVKEWSWCGYRRAIIKNKQTLSDAVLDGCIPEQHNLSPQAAMKKALNWLRNIEGDGEVKDTKRRKIKVNVSPETIRRRERKYGDFTKLNCKWSQSKSSTTHERLNSDPTEYTSYHNSYDKEREGWGMDHLKEIIIPYLNNYPDAVIGDFGCGPKTEIANSIDNIVLSFDHVASDDVIDCDVCNMPEEYHNSLDIAVYSLSFMAHNVTDYFIEAHKCLRENGHLVILENNSKIGDVKKLKSDIRKLGYKNVKLDPYAGFVLITADRSNKKPDPKVKIKLSKKK
jgi:superfamily II DNA or RNA helicase